jgi:hypothetical protein
LNDNFLNSGLSTIASKPDESNHRWQSVLSNINLAGNDPPKPILSSADPQIEYDWIKIPSITDRSVRVGRLGVTNGPSPPVFIRATSRPLVSKANNAFAIWDPGSEGAQDSAEAGPGGTFNALIELIGKTL